MRNESFLFMIMLLALLLLMGSGCTSAHYRGGTPYSEALCASGEARRAAGMPQGYDKAQWDYETVFVCSGGIQ